MNADERRYTLPRFHASTLLLLAATAALATPFGVYADADACVQSDWRAICPVEPNTLAAVDPNAAAAVLPPVPGDPNGWELPAGPWKRLPAICCDPEGDDFAIEYIAGTSPATVVREPGRWSFAAVVLEGPNAWLFEATDSHGASRRVIVAAEGRRNDPPVLE